MKLDEEQLTVKKELKEIYISIKVLQKDFLEKLRNEELEAAEMDKLVKLTSSFKSLRETAYHIFDILTIKETKDIELKEKQLKLQEASLELNAELSIARMEGKE